MDRLDFDFHILSEDFEKVIALESLGTRPNDPSFLSVSRRWVAAEYAGENLVHGVTAVGKRTTRDALGVAAGAGKKLSAHMAWTFKDWAKERIGQIQHSIDEATKKSTRLKKSARGLQEKVHEMNSLTPHPIKTAMWTSKLCVEDKIDIKACMAFASADATQLEQASDAYIVFTKSVMKDPKKLDEGSGKLDKLGKSTGWAVKRAAGLIGFAVGTDVKAYALPGNVVVVVRNYDSKNEVVDYAVARDGEYKDTIPSLSLDECKHALKAVIDLADALYNRNIKRKGLGYGAITEAANPKGSYFGDDMSSRDIHNITRTIKNSNSIEDALVAAKVRVGEGLLTLVEQSIKKQ